MNGLRLVFLYRFLDEMLKWLLNSPLLNIPKLFNEKTKDITPLTNTKQALPIVSEDIKLVTTVSQSQSKSSLPQLDIAMENMELIIPLCSYSDEHIIGSLGSIILSNKVLVDDSMTVLVNDAKIGTMLQKFNEPLPLFNQSQVSVELRDEFSNIKVNLDEVVFGISHKQYLFLMTLLSGNLSESSRISAIVYPKQQLIIKDIVTEEQKQQMAQVCMHACMLTFFFNLFIVCRK